ncbi:alpha/beta fold hydrolase [Nocardia sp. SYP-A9097]|uniref:alpha/beta fold hydrolase n=1 Tax=Nocardia sp. SYP-A9097 TaxID=2663237 RepID=UPI00129B3CCB|nr:alpha/beta fold hydrolase [Nocardia sp. SYP-A9097]MRH92244.1 alpha/beta fold hydrolase [Nocardia sp. SYP-A9097]
MAKIGRFRNDASREAFLRAYTEAEALWPLPATTSDIETSFGSTHVRRSGTGDGTPIVLLHNFGGNGLTWYQVVEDFARNRVVYALDTVGTASRSVQTAPLAKESDFAAWLQQVLDALGLERVHLIGYSHGAWHTAAVALHDSRRLASITLIEPGGVLTKPEWKILWKMVQFGMKGKSDANLRAMMEWLSPGVELTPLQAALVKPAIEYRMKIGWARVLKDAELQSITVPTLVIFGGESLVAHPEVAGARIAEHLPHGETVTYPGVGHGLLFQIPDQIAARTLEFIEQHEDAPATR